MNTNASHSKWNFLRFLKKYNTIISFLLGVAGLLIGLLSSSDQVLLIKLMVVSLFVIIFYLLQLNDSLVADVRILNQRIIQFNNTVDNISLEILNKFRNSPDRNYKATYEEITQKIIIDGNDVFVEVEYRGCCNHKEGLDSLYYELYSDGDSKFNRLDFKYFDLKNNSKALKPKKIDSNNKTFLVTLRLPKKLRKSETFHIKYTCVFRNCMSYDDDYYTTHIPKCVKGLKTYKFSMIFAQEKPEFVEVFDGTNGGESIFIKRLETESENGPYSYFYCEDDIMDSRDFVYIFRRNSE